MKATVGTEPEEPWLIWTEERYGSVVDFTVIYREIDQGFERSAEDDQRLRGDEV